MLALSEQIERHELGGAPAGVGAEQDEQIAGAREPVDAHRRRQQPLGLLDVEVSGTDDDVHAGDAVGAECERGDRLGAPHAVDALDATQPAGPEDRGVDLTVGPRRGADGHVEHAGRARRDDAHDDGAGVWRAPPRDIYGGRGDWELAQQDALSLGQLERPVGPRSRLGDLGDVGDRHLQPGDDVERQALDRLVELLGCDGERPGLAAGGVEAPRVVDHRRLPLRADALDDLADGILHRGGACVKRAQVPRDRDGPAEAAGVLEREALDAHLR